jgi:hypothetical protein
MLTMESLAMHRTLILAEPADPIGRSWASTSPLDIGRLVHPPDWGRLPLSLRRRFEAVHGPATYRGALTCDSSAVGSLFAWLSRMFGAPLAAMQATNLPVAVDVRPIGSGVAWSRQLGPTRCVRSIKSAGPSGTLLERTDGGLGMVLDISVEDGALVFTSRSFFLAVGPWRVPIPAVLTPGRCRVEHQAIDDARFRFTLTMVHPLWGTTFHQTGVFTESQETP